MASNASRTIGIALLLLFGTVQVAASQTFLGGIRGAVRDASGVLPGVEVTLTNEATGARSFRTTNAVGEYAFSNVLPGTYSLAATLAAYKKFESRGLIVGTHQILVVDVVLEVGAVAEQVTVTGATPLVDRANASVASLIDKATLDNLPSSGRNPFLFATTIPNVIPVGDPQFTRMQDQNTASLLAIAGGPPRANTYLLDGAPITDLLNRAVIIPSAEAIEEVSVQVHTYDASFGRTAGGVFNSTHRSGGNIWHGSALVRNRPDWGSANRFFADHAGIPKPEGYHFVWAGSAGGPIVSNRTFFWAATEGYRTRTVANSVLTWPTEPERRGDFSQSFDAAGRLIVIYDPLTTRPNPTNPGQFVRDPFPGNVIPSDRIDPVAREVARYYPLPDSGRRATRAAPIADLANQATTRVDHRFGGGYSIAGTYAWYQSTEPSPLFFDGLPSDPGHFKLQRDVHLAGFSNLFTQGKSTVYEVRYGFLRFTQHSPLPEFGVASLGFDPRYSNQVPVQAFPTITLAGYNSLGAAGPGDQTLPSQTVNATMTRLIGRHTIKVGGDFRRLGLDVHQPGTSGSFNFTRAFTQGPNPNVAATNAGDAVASLLLGFPAGGSVQVGAPQRFAVGYYAGYVHDDFRASSNLTLNLGLRYELEEGLRELNNQFTVGFDRERPFPVQIAGLDLRGGLRYAGVDRYPTQQSNPTRAKVGPRVGVAWAIGSQTVARGGYGLFWGPHQFQLPSENTLGTRGFSSTTTYFASADGGLTPCAGCRLSDPFPGGIERPLGSTLGLATGAGGDIHFNDQFRESPYVHKFSVDLQRELHHAIALSVGYVGSRMERLDIGGTSNSAININQLDPAFQALGTALQTPVPNPFFGHAAFGAFSTQPTIARGQLLRPYPQFGDVFAHQLSAGRARYHSLVLEARRRFRNGWGGRINYTWSRAEDNVVGENNFFSNRGGAAQLVLNNYDLDAEFGRSLLDVPHRLNASGTFELPFGEGKRWLNGRGLPNALFGGWAATVVGYGQSGFPIRVVQDNNNSGLFGSSQRPNVVPGVEPFLSADYDPACPCVRWLNPSAWSSAAPFTFGNAPRVDPRVRTAMRTNWDLAVEKRQRVRHGMLTVRAEVLNAFNHVDLTGPIIQWGRSDFGQILSDGGFPRTLQLMVRWQF